MRVIASEPDASMVIPATVHERQERSGWRGIVAVLLVFVTVGASCSQGIPKNVADRLKPVTLVWWGVNETEADVAPLISEYQRTHPNVSVRYQRFRFAEYEARLLDALAERDFEGPDIFALPSSWTRKYRSKLLPAPSVITMPFRETRGTVKPEVVAELRTTRTPAPSELQNLFLDVVIPDAVLPAEQSDGSDGAPAVFGLPLSVDSLVLIANRDLLNAAGIPEPARTWEELRAHVPRLTRFDSQRAIVQAGVALGTGTNVQRSFDILSLLMMQNGAVMAAPNGSPTFHQIPQSLTDRTTPPGEDALLFYTDFANPQQQVYTWDATMPDSLEAFLQGRAAYVFGYSYHLPIIAARAPRINVRVSGVPHLSAALDPTTGLVVGSDVIEGSQPVAINAANFWLETVSERTKYVNEAWDFVLFTTTRQAEVRKFLAATGRPTALLSLVGEQLQDPTMKVFASQLLTSRTWYRGKDPDTAERIFRELVEDVVAGRMDAKRALQLAAQKIEQTL